MAATVPHQGRMDNNKKRKAEETARRPLPWSNRNVRILARKYKAMLDSQFENGTTPDELAESMLEFIDVVVKHILNRACIQDWDLIRKQVEEDQEHRVKQAKRDADCEAEEALRGVGLDDECRRIAIEQAKKEAYAEADAMLKWSTSSEDE
jgi:hypothetical protein